MRSSLARTLALACAASLVLAAGFASAQSTDLSTYQGADRAQKLAEAAKKDGQLNLYTSAPIDDIKVLTEAFEKQYGVKVNVWRAGADRVGRRGAEEAKAKQSDADVFETTAAALEGLARSQVLKSVRSPAVDALASDAVHDGWVTARMLVYVLAYNPRLVKKGDLPRRWEGLLDPRWKGKLSVEAEDADWFSAICAELGEQAATKLFRDIVAKNGVVVHRSHALLLHLVEVGNVPLALTAYSYQAQRAKAKGEQVDWFVIPPAIARVNGVGIAAKAPHPNAAMLWLDYELSAEAQTLLAGRGYAPVLRGVDSPVGEVPLHAIDAKAMLDDAEKWQKAFDDVFGSPSTGPK